MEIQKPRDLLRNQFLNDFVVGLGELFKAAAVEVGEVAVIEAEHERGFQ
jgi:hypothetical protein